MWNDATALGAKQRANLRQLAHSLLFMPLPISFSMKDFCWPEDGDWLINCGRWEDFQLKVTAVSECGTAACAAGFGTIFVEPKQEFEDWDCYLIRVFGVDFASQEGVWMFGGCWEDVDNTPQGAAARIEWLLDKGVPDMAWEQMRGKVPLCYRKTTGEV